MSNDVEQSNDLFSLLTTEDQQSLTQMGQSIDHYITENGESAWQTLDKVILPNLSKINFSQLANDCPPSETYNRIICPVKSDSICLVLFVFKVESSDDAAILLHVYGDPLPNYKIFSTDKIINKSKARENVHVKQTLPHTHKTHCYSCIAWTHGNVELSEENYTLRDDGMLELVQQSERPLHSCVYDDSKDQTIHSISVRFN